MAASQGHKTMFILINIFLFEFLILLSSSLLPYAGKKRIIEAETSKGIGGITTVADRSASGGYLVSLAIAGQAITFDNLPAANKLAIRYASIKVGTITVAVNDQRSIKVNIHSSGASTVSFLYAIIDIKIAARCRLSPSKDAQIRRLAWKVMLVLAGSIAGAAIWFIIVQKWFIGEFCFYCMTLHLTGILLTVLVTWRATKILSIRPAGMIFIGVIMSGIMAASQAGFAHEAAYFSGRSQNSLPVIDYNRAPVIGSPAAPYVVQLLFDYQCPHCQKIYFMLNEAVRRYKGKLAFALCPAPLNTQCNPYIPQDAAAFKNSCELTRIGLKVWVAKPGTFAAFENWMFTFESGDKWHPRSLEAARAKAVELVGKEKFDDIVGDDWVQQYMQTCIQIYGQTIQTGKGGIPKLIFGSRWVIPEPDNEEDFMMILQKSLAIPKP